MIITANKKKETTKDARLKAEYERLVALYKDLPIDTQALYDGLIRRAAYMRVTLEDYERDLDAGGYVESFTQSPNTPPYERERPVARLYNSMNKNYQSIMRQLSDALPEPLAPGAADEINAFLGGGVK